MRHDGNIIVMGDGEKQLLPKYIFSIEPTGFANGSHTECDKKRTSGFFK